MQYYAILLLCKPTSMQIIQDNTNINYAILMAILPNSYFAPVVPCPTGNFYNVVQESCQSCPVSQYQDQSGQISCKPCPDGKTTSDQGAVSSEECIGEV